MASVGRDAARAAVRPHRRRHRDDLVQRPGQHQHHPAVRSEPRHRRRRARRAGRHQRRARAAARRTCRTIPTYRKVNPGRRADPDPGADLGQLRPRRRCTTSADSILAQKLAQVEGVGQVIVGGGSQPAVRVELNPTAAEQLSASASTRCAPRSRAANANRPKGSCPTATARWQIDTTDQLFKADEYQPLIVSLSQRRAVRLARCGDGHRLGRGPPQRRPGERQAGRADHPLPPAGRQHHRDGGPRPRAAAAAAGLHSAGHQHRRRGGPHHHHPRLGARRRVHPAALDRAGDPGGVPVPAQRLGHGHSRASPCRSRCSARSA